MDRTRHWSMVDPKRQRSSGSPKHELTGFVGSERSSRRCNRESSLWGSLPAARTGGGGAVMGRWWEGTISGGGARWQGDWSTDGVSCETKWERGTMGEPTVAFIGSRTRDVGSPAAWDINGGIGFEAKKNREGVGRMPFDEGKWRQPDASLIPLPARGGEWQSAAPAGAVAARVLSKEGDDPRVGWLGQKWAASWANFRWKWSKLNGRHQGLGWIAYML
jgi:hypothetical protein